MLIEFLIMMYLQKLLRSRPVLRQFLKAGVHKVSKEIRPKDKAKRLIFTQLTTL